MGDRCRRLDAAPGDRRRPRAGARRTVGLQPGQGRCRRRRAGGTRTGGRARDGRSRRDPRAGRRCRAPRRQQGPRCEHQHRRHRGVARVGQGRHHDDVVQPPRDVRRGGGGADRRRVRAIGDPLPRRGGAPRLHVRAPRDHADRRLEDDRLDHGAGVRRLLDRPDPGDARRPDGHGQGPGRHLRRQPDVPCGSIQYEQAIQATADVLGVEIERIEAGIETAVVDHDLELAIGTIPAGTVVGQILSWTGYHDGSPFLVAEEQWVVTKDIPQWDLSIDDAPFIRVIVEGLPRLQLDLTIDHAPVPGLPSSTSGHLMVGMTALRALPYVRQAPPGVVTAPVFGAARVPDAPTEPVGGEGPFRGNLRVKPALTRVVHGWWEGFRPFPGSADGKARHEHELLFRIAYVAPGEVRQGRGRCEHGGVHPPGRPDRPGRDPPPSSS